MASACQRKYLDLQWGSGERRYVGCLSRNGGAVAPAVGQGGKTFAYGGDWWRVLLYCRSRGSRCCRGYREFFTAVQFRRKRRRAGESPPGTELGRNSPRTPILAR